MIPEEIRATHIEQPLRLRPLSKEGREERGQERDRFSRDLATLAHEGPAGQRQGSQSEQPEPDAEAELHTADGPQEDATRPGLGRNLDITT